MPLPPVAASVCEYAAPTAPLVSGELVVMDGAIALIVTVTKPDVAVLNVAVCPLPV